MTFPLTDKITQCDITTSVKTLITRSLNGNEQRAQVDTQRWQANIVLSNISDTERRELMSFIANQNGSLNAFNFELPGDLGKSSAGYTGTITTSTGGNAGDTSISVSGNNSTAILKDGDLIRFTGKNKTYTVIGDVTTNISGVATVNFSPALVESISSGVVVTHNPVLLNMRFDGDDYGFSTNPTIFSNINLRLIEVL